MSRFFNDSDTKSTFKAPSGAMPNGAPTLAKPKSTSVPVSKEQSTSKQEDIHAKAQEPIRKTEGGRYEDVDYEDLL